MRTFEHPEYGVVLWSVKLDHITTQEDPHGCSIEKTDWPFVPRVGEVIDLTCEEHGTHSGTVRVVMWDDHGQPLVRYR